MRVIYILFLLILTSCAHDFKGGRPDFTKGEAEYNRFKIHGFYRYQVEMQGDGFLDGYTKTKSVLPLIKEISPDAYEEYRDLQVHRTMSDVMFGVTLGLVAVAYSQKGDAQDDWAKLALYSSLLFAGHGLYLFSRHQDVGRKYNEDLQSKFAPGVGWIWTY